MITPNDPDFDRTDDLTWYSYRVVTRDHSTGERREQVWMGYDANHALERAHRSGMFVPIPDEVTATWESGE